MLNIFDNSSVHDEPWTTEKEDESKLEIVLNGITFHSADAGERFYVDDPDENLTVNQALTKAYPIQFKSHACRLKEIPEPLLLLSTSSRIRIIRAAQIHHLKYPVDAYATEVKNFLDALAFVDNGDRFAWSQYNNIKWALDYADDDKAAATLLRLGMIYHKTTGPSCDLPSQHLIEQREEGIYIKIDNPFSLQDRVNNACLSVLNQYLQDRRRMAVKKWDTYFQIGCVALYKQNGWFLSLTSDFAELAKGCVKSYVFDLLNQIRETSDDLSDVPMPSIDEPMEWVPPQEFLIPWSDFEFTSEASQAVLKRNRDNALQQQIEALTRRLVPNGFLPGVPYRRAELLNYINTQQITRATRNGLLSSPKRGEYYLDFLQDIYDDNPEFESEEE